VRDTGRVSGYRLVSPAGQAAENGEADVSVTGGALVVAPKSGAALRVPFGQIAAVTEPEPFVVRIDCTDGSAVELSRLGVMRTQLLAELRDGRADTAAASAGAVGAAATFPGWCGETPVQVRVYDDAFMVDAERIGFSFVTDIQLKDYAVTVAVAGREPVTLTRLGRQTTELTGLLTQRLREARVRTASFLGSLLPGLGPVEARSAAAALRDGVAVPAAELDRIHPALSGTLLGIATLPARSEAVAVLAERTGLAIGFKQRTSVRRPATGTEPWHDHAAPTHSGGHASSGGAFGQGAAGMMAAGMMSDIGAGRGFGFEGGPGFGFEGGPGFGFEGGPGFGFEGGPGFGFEGGPGFGFGGGLGAFGEYWAFRALGASMNASPQQRPMASRPDVSRGLLTPATDDPAALTVNGAEPTVLAFALCAVPGRVLYEVLNQPEQDTYVFIADDEGGLSTLNRALDEAGFRPEEVGRSLSDRIPHDDHWQQRVARLVAC
jgi:hypothetical protein